MPKEYAPDEVRVCGYCFLEWPMCEEHVTEETIFWLKCSFCNLWAHMDACGKLDEKCCVCSVGFLRYSEEG